ncbi:MAG TPA: TonB-dependent receptor, partial [Longimicrobiales bacterium]|nr:TonB-dependent receptor [Longimicrobiales bacterium]
NDIDNIEVVKGPAASAMYGTAAANGVILITTKRGRPGTTKWNAFVESGIINDVTDYPDNFLSYEIRDSSKPLFRTNGLFSNDTTAYVICNNRSVAAGTCTQDATMSFNTLMDSRTTPFVQGHHQVYGLSVRGGTEAVRYFVSGQYTDEQGVISFNTMKQTNFRANLDAKLATNTDMSVSFGYAGSTLSLNNNDNSIFSPLINGLLGRAYYVPPDETRSGGTPVNNYNYGFQFNMDELSNLPSYQGVDRYMSSANLKWRPLSWLSFSGNAGLDLTDNNDYETLQRNKLPIAYSYANGYRADTRGTRYLYTLQGSSIGTFELTPDLVSTTTVGAQYTRNNNEDTYCYGSSLIPGTASCGTTSELFSIDENYFEVRTMGYYVQQEFGWRDKMFLAGGIRGDDNSNFGQNLGFIYYPSVSLSWVLGDEEWFPHYDWLNTVRLRSAWGTAGLTPGFRQAVTLYNATTVAMPVGDRAGVSLGVTGNDLLKPERTREYEMGFDTGLFDNRLSLAFTYFNRKSSNALISRRLPPSLGLTASVFDNLGSALNSGTELGLHANIIDSRMFGLNLGLNNTTIHNKILELGKDVQDIILNRGTQRHTNGYSMGSFFQPKVTWNDADGNGKLTNSEVTVDSVDSYLGPSLPTWERSVYADVRFSDWLTLSTLFEGRGGNYQMYDTEAFRCHANGSQGCAAVADPNASLRDQAAYIAYQYLGSEALYVEKADFYKWRELSVTLRLPEAWATKVPRAQGLSLTLAGRNLATFTKYPGLDPEVVEASTSQFNQSEFNTQPPVRYLTIRLDYVF